MNNILVSNNPYFSPEKINIRLPGLSQQLLFPGDISTRLLCGLVAAVVAPLNRYIIHDSGE